MSHSTFLTGVVNTWNGLLPLLASVLTEHTVKWQPDGRALGIEIRAHRHLALVQAWDQAQCLDVTIMDIAAETSTILSAGPCAQPTDVSDRLGLLARAIR